MNVYRYALPLTCLLPGDLPEPSGYPLSTEPSGDWYAVVIVSDDEAVIEDVLRWEWPLPEDCIDERGAKPCGS